MDQTQHYAERQRNAWLPCSETILQAVETAVALLPNPQRAGIVPGQFSQSLPDVRLRTLLEAADILLTFTLEMIMVGEERGVLNVSQHD